VNGTIYLHALGGLAQLARASAWHAQGHRFDSGNLHLIRPEYSGFFHHIGT
jgi:hypothetical protein